VARRDNNARKLRPNQAITDSPGIRPRPTWQLVCPRLAAAKPKRQHPPPGHWDVGAGVLLPHLWTCATTTRPKLSLTVELSGTVDAAFKWAFGEALHDFPTLQLDADLFDDRLVVRERVAERGNVLLAETTAPEVGRLTLDRASRTGLPEVAPVRCDDQ